MPWQVDIKQCPRPTNIWLLDLGDTSGKYSCLQFMIVDRSGYYCLSAPDNEVKALFAYIVMLTISRLGERCSA